MKENFKNNGPCFDLEGASVVDLDIHTAASIGDLQVILFSSFFEYL